MSKIDHRANQLLDFTTGRDLPVRANGEDLPSFRRQKAVPRRAKVVAYKFDQAAQSSPNVGDSVAIRHRTDVQPKGNVRLIRDGIDQRTVKAVYFTESEGYSIKDSVGEQWLVRPSAIGGSKWETFNVGEGRKELA